MNAHAEIRRAKEILKILKLNLSIPELSDLTRNPFKLLVGTIISQATTEINARRAYKNLSEKLTITPEGLAKAEIREIEESLKVAGLQRNKSKVIKNVSTLVLERFNGSLDFAHNLPLDEARTILMSLPGVGPKTADIILLFWAKKPTLPVDTHVNRVSKRLGLVPSKADYEVVRRGLQELYHLKEYYNVHMLLIALGRKYCKAIKPLHALCPCKKLCPSAEN